MRHAINNWDPYLISNVSGEFGEVDVNAADAQRWHPVTRIAFRFCFVYFGLFCLTFATGRRANRNAAAVQVVLGIWVLIGCVAVSWQARTDYGDGRPKPELYGIWSVTEFTVGGNPVPPLTTDEKRWQRIVFDEPGILTYQRMDDELVPVPAELHSDTITVPTLRATLRFDRPDPHRLRLVGQLDG